MDFSRILTAIGSKRIGKLFIPPMFKDLLKENAQTHKKLGEIPLLICLEDKNVTCEEYILALKKMYGLYAALEPMLEKSIDWNAIGIDFNQRKRLPMLERDLKKFGISSDKLGGIEVCKELPELLTLSEVLGFMAVIEGSTAGATATAEKLAASKLQLRPDNGAEFFNNYGDRRNEMRMNFAKAVTEQKVNRDEFLAGGKKAFDIFYAWLAL
ncbi:MAG: biliverdin-producing heme oxygenase [Candidatus Melainabacteria bacterium]|nr:biliverdin-producing heme oxygenase [Candidatus Melainabacteria bacterium]